jgi:signal transduction histidine kinase
VRRLTLRARLTLIYGGLFLGAGVVLLAVTYAMFNQQLAHRTQTVIGKSVAGAPSTPRLNPNAEVYVNGELLSGAEAEQWLVTQQSTLRDAAATSLLTQGGIALGAVGGAAAGLGWLVAGRVLSPLHRVTDAARRIAAAPSTEPGLHERIALRGPHDEVKNLADAFDTMVERLDRSFDGQRRFVASASHELRTPLTVGRSLIELAMHRRSASADVQRLGEDLLEINSRHERLITGLLMLTKSENEITEKFPVDLADLVTHVVTQTAPEAERAGITVHEQADDALTLGDGLLLERLVHNLVENGIRHNTGPGGTVEVVSRTVAEDGVAVVEVRNTGPVVPRHEVQDVFEPFRRLGADRIAGGAGLGLSIVRAVAIAHGGEATAQPREGGGLVVTVRLPASTYESEDVRD